MSQGNLYIARGPQLHEMIANKSNEDPLGFVSRNRYFHLDYLISQSFSREQVLYNMAFRLAHDDILYIGELVRMSKREILPYLRNKPDYLDRLVEKLSARGLCLNARVPGWHRPPERIYAIADS